MGTVLVRVFALGASFGQSRSQDLKRPSLTYKTLNTQCWLGTIAGLVSLFPVFCLPKKFK